MIRPTAVMPSHAGLLGRTFPALARVDAIARAPLEAEQVANPLEQRKRAFSAIRDLLSGLARRQPVVLAIDVERMRHEHVGAECATDPFGDDGLAVTRLAIEEQRLPRIDCRSELVQHRPADDQMFKTGRQPVRVHRPLCRHAGTNVGVVLRQRNRGGTDVAAHVHVLVGAIAPEVGEDVAIPGGPGAAGAADFHQLLDARMLDQRIEQRIGDLEPVRQCAPAGLAADTLPAGKPCES